jgi:hypothetical protein
MLAHAPAMLAPERLPGREGVEYLRVRWMKGDRSNTFHQANHEQRRKRNGAESCLRIKAQKFLLVHNHTKERNFVK